MDGELYMCCGKSNCCSFDRILNVMDWDSVWLTWVELMKLFW